MKKVRGIVALALFFAIFSPISVARADDPNPSVSEIDNYGSLTTIGNPNQGFFVSNSTFINSSPGSFTIEAWINPSESLTASNATIFIKQDSLVFRLNSLRPELSLQNAGWTAFTSNAYLRTNEWQHVAVVKSAGTVSMYINGSMVYQSTGAVATVNTYTSLMGIGASNWNGSANQSTPASEFFSGGIDEVRVWSTARSQSEIQNNMDLKISGSSTYLLAYWDFNGSGSATTLYDRTSNSNNLTIYGNPTFPDVKSVVTVPGYSTITFPRTYLNSAGGFKIPKGVSLISALVVGGGGGGGFDGGGGGGGGGVYQNNSLAVTPETRYAVVVGGGGPAINGYIGGTFCAGTHSGTVQACTSAGGNTSKYGAITASGGGGGGGIENSGGSDSDSLATVRGGGGGAGSQNSNAGSVSAGSGAFSGGGVLNVSANGAGGGGSGVAGGSSSSSATAGAGAGGTVSTLTTFTYGSGGGGGTWSGSTVASGGVGAGDGAIIGAAASKPISNRGGGGGGGGNGGYSTNGIANSYGTSGAAGVVIIKYALAASSSVSFTNAPVYKTSTTITASVNTASRVTFLANNKRIPGCIKVATSNLTATCNWKPALHGYIAISIQVIPIDTNYTSSIAQSTAVFTTRRLGNR